MPRKSDIRSPISMDISSGWFSYFLHVEEVVPNATAARSTLRPLACLALAMLLVFKASSKRLVLRPQYDY